MVTLAAQRRHDAHGIGGLQSRGWVAPLAARKDPGIAAIHQAATRRFAEGWSDVESAATKYRDRAWMKAVPELQSWASMLLGMGLDQAKVVMPEMLKTFIEPFYNSVATLEALNIPMLWIIAGDDMEAPPGPTLATLATLQRKGKRIQTKVFPHTDHGITEFTTLEGRRTPTRYPPDYANTMVRWIVAQTRR